MYVRKSNLGPRPKTIKGTKAVMHVHQSKGIVEDKWSCNISSKGDDFILLEVCLGKYMCNRSNIKAHILLKYNYYYEFKLRERDITLTQSKHQKSRRELHCNMNDTKENFLSL